MLGRATVRRCIVNHVDAAIRHGATRDTSAADTLQFERITDVKRALDTEGNLDAVLADSFPASDPPSWIPSTAEAGTTIRRPPVTTFSVGYFVGSLAKASINRKLANALVRLAPAELVLTEIPFRDLPLYCYDSDADFPPPARALKEAIAGVDAILFVTPEYNRSIPGGLKNAIDWASRPYGTELVFPKAIGDHRHVSREDRDGDCSGASAQHHGLL